MTMPTTIFTTRSACVRVVTPMVAYSILPRVRGADWIRRPESAGCPIAVEAARRSRQSCWMPPRRAIPNASKACTDDNPLDDCHVTPLAGSAPLEPFANLTDKLGR